MIGKTTQYILNRHDDKTILSDGKVYVSGTCIGTVVSGPDQDGYYKASIDNSFITSTRQSQMEQKIRSYLDDVWRALFTRLDPKWKKNLFFAGGCFQSIALGEEVNDYDLWCDDFKAGQEIFSEIEKKKVGIVDKGKSIYFYVDDYQLNFVKNCMGTPQQTIEDFDFAHAQNYYAGDGSLKLSPQLGKRELIFNIECSNALGSIYRVKKFLARDYTITGREMRRILDAASLHAEKYFGNNTSIDKLGFADLSSFYQDNT